MTQNQIITVTARKNMVRARAGEIQLPKIVGFVFGDGGVDESGNIIPLSETDSTLGNELLRKKYDGYTMVSDTECKYECTLTEEELAVFKRGRNASKASVSKHASPEEYRASTGFECLLGWLYLNGQLDRVHELFDTLWQQFDPNETR